MSKDDENYKPYYDSKKIKDIDPFGGMDAYTNYDWQDIKYPPPKIEYPKNFVEKRTLKGYVFIEHLVTRERKWVAKQAIYKDGVPSAFYDADPKFAPEGK
ncbi:MAG: hypothetical protein CMQ41_07860 [Gammaproteobacteria bacterium]|nr:hypothetical protein [Gammaproteobacteria bacterium]